MDQVELGDVFLQVKLEEAGVVQEEEVIVQISGLRKSTRSTKSLNYKEGDERRRVVKLKLTPNDSRDGGASSSNSKRPKMNENDKEVVGVKRIVGGNNTKKKRPTSETRPPAPKDEHGRSKRWETDRARARRKLHLKLEELLKAGKIDKYVMEQKKEDFERVQGQPDKTDEELAAQVREILTARRAGLARKAAGWEAAVTPDGQVLMTRAEMLKVIYQHKVLVMKKNRAARMTPEELAQQKEAAKFRNLTKRIQRTEEDKQRDKLKHFLYQQARLANMTEEEREQEREKKREQTRQYIKSLEGEKKERYEESVRKAVARYCNRNREKQRQFYREKFTTMSPEERAKKLLSYRVSQAKRLLRKKLEAAGAPPEQIEEEVDQLVRRMESEPLPPPDKVSVYKPRSDINQPQTTFRKRIRRPRAAKKVPTNSFQTPQPSASSSSSELRQPYWGTDYSTAAVAATAPCNGWGDEVDNNVPVPFNNGEGPDLQSDYDHSSMPADSADYYHAPSSPPPSPLGSPPHMSAEVSPDASDNDELAMSGVQVQSPAIPVAEKAPKANKVKVKMDVIKAEPIFSPLFAEPIVPASVTPPPTTEVPPPATSTNEVKCPHCPSLFSRLTLHPHIRSTHPEKGWKCPKCSTLVYSPQDLMDHFKSHHAAPGTAVVKTENSKPDKSSLVSGGGPPVQRNKAAASSTPPKTFHFVCMKCPAVSSSKTQFETQKSLADHVRTTHPKSFFPCPKCKLLKYDSASLKIHSKICSAGKTKGKRKTK